MIKRFAHKGLERFFKTGKTSGIQAKHASKLSRQLAKLHTANKPDDMDVPGWNLHPLRGNQAAHWSVKVSGNWRMTFKFVGEDVELVNYLDYH